MQRLLSLVIVFVILLGNVLPVFAQASAELISLHPMSAEVRAVLEDWIASSAPVAAPVYAVTYIKPRGLDWVVSLAALNIPDGSSEWHFVEEDGSPSAVMWVGSVVIKPDGSVEEKFIRETASRRVPGLAMIRAAGGGGSYLSFPFGSGTYAIFGPRGIHGSGDYGTSGMIAVDLVGGDNLSGSFDGTVYASDDGIVDYVCDDGTSVAVRTYNAGTGDYFIYAHMLDNANLVIDHEFAQNATIGSLKYGSFSDSCGWADQQSTHFHNHWMFTPSGGSFQAANCILTVSSQKWTCGTETIGVGGKLYGGGGTGTGTGTDDPGAVNAETAFFDYLLIGFVSIFDRGLLKLLPEHNSPSQLLLGVMNVVRIFFRLVWTLTRFNLNLGPVMVLLLIVIGSKITFGIIFIIAAILRTIKILPGA